jgi:hypothetical protein
VGTLICLCIPDLFRFQRLHRYCHRAGKAAWHTPSGEFQSALPESEPYTILEQLAYDPDAMVPGLFLQSRDSGFAVGQEVDLNPCDHLDHTGRDDGVDRTMARCDYEFYFMGFVAWPGAVLPQPLVRVDQETICFLPVTLAAGLECGWGAAHIPLRSDRLGFLRTVFTVYFLALFTGTFLMWMIS